MTHIASKAKVPTPPGQGLYAPRMRIYQMAVSGPIRRFKWLIVGVCLTIYYGLPWVRWDRGPGLPDQGLLLDIGNRRFYVFNMEFWPQDIYFLTGLLIMAALTLFLVTSLVGRVWCGFTCPQTVWTDLFMMVERRIEGDRNKRMKRDAAPLSFDKAWRKVVKHGIWLAVAFWTGGAWIMYYADAPTVTREFWTGHASVEVYGFIALFTFTTYTLAGWAREQVCTYMCPWPRFQSAMLDDQSYVVTYEDWRGEPRAHGKHGPDLGFGDCVDCSACVNVCPTGIDIRDGLQLECINCGLCVDACNNVMRKTGRKPWLITWDTEVSQDAKREGRREKTRFLRARTYIYIFAMLLAATVMGIGFATRPTIGLIAMHDRAPLFIRLQSGAIRNAYTIKLTNKTTSPTTFVLSVPDLPGATLVQSEENAERLESLSLKVGPDSEVSYRVLVQALPSGGHTGSQPISFTIHDEATGAEKTYRSVFVWPG